MAKKKIAKRKAERKVAKKKVPIQIKQPKKVSLKYAHIFDETALSFHTYGLLLKEQAVQQNDLAQVRSIDSFLLSKTPSEDWVKLIDTSSFFRIVEFNRNPISCLGSFSCGGRVNIGTPQLIKEFEGRLNPQFGLYGSLELETAKEEYDSAGLPSISSDIYKLSFNGPSIRLFDFDKIIETASQEFHEFPLLSVVSEIPYNAAWKYQKSPKVSQVIGSWLRNFSNSLNVHGILFRSTKRREGSNLFLFFNDELESAKAKLTLTKL